MELPRYMLMVEALSLPALLTWWLLPASVQQLGQYAASTKGQSVGADCCVSPAKGVP